MTKFITQHRRGTTDEWQQNKDLVIADGELVIEECGDHVKIKVGDGVSTFEELPYITKKIDTSIATSDARINELIKRIDNGETITDPNGELADIRVGYGGVTYDTAGDAVRAVAEQVDTLSGSLQNFINADAFS